MFDEILTETLQSLNIQINLIVNHIQKAVYRRSTILYSCMILQQHLQ